MISCLIYNIHFGRKLRDILEWVGREVPGRDVICFQEFPVDKLQFALGALAPFWYQYTYGTGFTKKGREYGQLTLYNPGKLKLTSATSLALGKSYLDEKFFRNGGERSATVARFIYKEKPLIIINTHLTCVALNARRIHQVKKILAYLQMLKVREKTPAVILGDFNYSSIVRQRTLLRTMEQYGFSNAYKLNTIRLLFVKHQVDYVFHKRCEVFDVHVKKVRYSDHFPVEFFLRC